jgi:hypothetical protein
MLEPRETIIARNGTIYLQIDHGNGLVEEHEVQARNGQTLWYATLAPDCELFYGIHNQPLPERLRAEVYRLADISARSAPAMG